MPARLAIRLLGAPSVHIDGQAVLGIEKPKILALLAYLAVEGAQAHTRRELATLFWPEQTDSKALQNLRQALSRLRKAIGDGRADPPHLLAYPKTIQFNRQSASWLDVSAFRRLVEATQQHDHRRLAACRTCLPHLAKAMDLYRGEFLAGLHIDAGWALDEWLLLLREELQQRAVRSLEALAAAYVARGEFKTAARYAQQLLALDPWNEAAERTLLRGLLGSQGRNAALFQYRAFRRALRGELGVEPEDETLALVDRIRAGTWTEREPRTSGPVPVPLTPYFGRRRELAQIGRRLEGRESRLLTICGPGGSGKSRLALEVAVRQAALWQHGVWFIPLAENIATQRNLVEALSTALTAGSGGAPRSLSTKELVDWLRPREMLLILDGYDQLAGDAQLLIEILRWAPEVRFLVTSRARLGVRQEWVIALDALDLPAGTAPSMAEAERSSAVQLFVASAQRVVPEFRLTEESLPAVARICHLVEGLPLGIELAAAWARILPVEKLAAEIEQGSELVRVPGSERSQGHNSLRETFEYSYGLLTRTEQALLRSLSVFHGGFTPGAAREITGAEIPDLAALHDASLLQPIPMGRFDLPLSLQDYAAAKLAAQPAAQHELEERHSRFYLAFLRQKAGVLAGGLYRKSEEIYVEQHNIRVAWEWAVSRARLDELDASLAPLSLLYDTRGLFQQAFDAFVVAAYVAAQANNDRAQRLTTRLLAEQASCLRSSGRYAQAGEVARRAIDEARAGHNRYSEAKAFFVLGEVAWRQGEDEKARSHLERAMALSRKVHDPLLEIDCVRILAGVHWRKGDYAGARAHLEAALHLARELGNKRQQGLILCNLGVVAVEQSDFAAAAHHYQQALELDRETGDRDAEGVVVTNLGNLKLYLGLYAKAEQYYREALKIHRETGARSSEAWTLSNLALVAHYQGHDCSALEYGREAVRRGEQIGDPALQAAAQMSLGHALLALCQWKAAAAAYGEAAVIRRAASQANLLAESLAGLAEVALAQGDIVRALPHVKGILHHLEGGEGVLDGTIDPGRVWLTCYRVLVHAGDLRAARVLGTANQWLQERTGRVVDESMRRSFLEEVASHRELVKAQSCFPS